MVTAMDGEVLVDFSTASSQRVLLPENCSKSDAIYILSKQIPQNNFGFPAFFYRSDLLPYDLACINQGDVESCIVDLLYTEGYPTLDNGTPFWEQLPHEPYSDYLLFRRFLEQAEDTGIRQLHLLAATERQPLDRCLQSAREYYWSVRAKAYDLFVVAAEQKKREHRIRKVENNHFDVSSKLFQNVLRKFEDDDWVDALGPAEALEALERLIKIQRTSLGLNGVNASSTPKDAPGRGASVELIMRQLAKSSGLQAEENSDFNDQLQMLLSDPEAGAIAQELILKVTSGH